MKPISRRFPAVLAAGFLSIVSAPAATSVLSYHNDSSASGVNSTETTLTPANVNTSTFAKRYATTVDGMVYAQPLYEPNVTVVGGTQAGVHNLAIVATQHDSLYAIDADSGVIVWHTTFVASGISGATSITPMPAVDTNSGDTSPEIGVCGTPVIDPATNLLYVAAKTKQILNGVTATPHYVYTLFKVDITNGNATANANIVSSTVIANTTYTVSSGAYSYPTASDPAAAQDPFVFGTGDGAIVVNGTSRVYFNAMRQMNRPGLLLYAGNIYVTFGSHGDGGPYHGWMLTFNKTSLALTAVLNLTPNGGLGGFWGGGAVPVVDANGAIYTMTGNGTFDGFSNNGVTAGLDSLGFPVNGDYGMSLVKIVADPTTTGPANQGKNGWGLKVADYFTPFNAQSLDSADLDLGSGGAVLLPDSAGNSAHPHLIVGAGKSGVLYLVDRDNGMGKFNATTDNVLETFPGLGSCFSTPSFFNGLLYLFDVGGPGRAVIISNAQFQTNLVPTPDTFGWPGSTTSISANGTTNGIVWALDRNTSELRAYSAANIGTELWTSDTAANGTDALGTLAKFEAPTVADGRVLVGTATALVVYGPPTPPGSIPAAPTSLAATTISSLEIDLSWTDNSNNEDGFAIEQSTDGTTFTQIATVGVNITSYAVMQNLQASTTYYYRVRAFNSFNGGSDSAYSNVDSATTSGQTASVNFGTGFASTTGLNLIGSTAVVNNRAELTNATGTNEAGALWSSTIQNVQKFITTFNFQLTSATAEGFTFCLQNSSPTAIGASGAGLGYQGIGSSIAVKFDLLSDATEGSNATGLYVNGAAPESPDTDLTPGGLDLHSGDLFTVTLSYDGTTLTEKITDTTTSTSQTLTYTVDIPGAIGSNTAYVGFTGSTGTQTAIQDIINWTYAPMPTAAPAAPTNLVATAITGTQINLSWTDNSTNEDGYLIMRKAGAGGTYSQVGVTVAGASSYSDTGLSPNVAYFYEVAATNSIGTSATTNEASATTPVPPTTPTNAQAVTVTANSITMTWTDTANNETGYNILRKTTTASNFAAIAQLPANSTTYTDTGLTPGTSYDYHIQAFNLAGYSDFSGFTATTLSNATLPTVTVSATSPVAVNGLVSGAFTFTRNAAAATSLPITYTVMGTAAAGSDYTTLSGSTTIPANATSVTVPVVSQPGATSNTTVIASISSNSNFVAATPANATVVIESPTFTAPATVAYKAASLTGKAGGNVTLTFPGLPGNPAAIYVWYFNGVAFATSTSASYTITNALASQSGAYEVRARAIGGTTGSATFNVTISNPALVLRASVSSLTVPDGTSGTFTASLSSAPAANTTVNVAISGEPGVTVSPATLTMTPSNYQNQVVTVTAAPINSTGIRAATVKLSTVFSTASVAITNSVGDIGTAANLLGAAYPLTGLKIGKGASGDASVRASGVWWLDGTGTGIAGRADAFFFESQSYTGDFQMVVNLQALVATGATAPLAGLMVRDGTLPGSNFLALAGQVATSGGYKVIKRTTVNTAATTTVTSGAGMTYTYPNAWMMLTRAGNVLRAFVSSDGSAFTEVTVPSTGVTWSHMSAALKIGVFTSSGNTAYTRAVMDDFSIVTPSVFTDADIGAPGLAGSGSLGGGLWTVKGGGADIWNTSDQFNFMSEPLTGDQTLVVHVRSVQGTDPWAKGGLMFRNSNSASSPFVAIYAVPNGQVSMQWRDSEGATASAMGLIGDTVNTKWLKLVKSGTTYSAYYATTPTAPGANDWILVHSHDTTFPNTNYLAGLAVTAHNNSLLCASVFDTFTVSNVPAVAGP